jgi:fatty-acyl-CoA synthase/long-chain acyl-CoA synthetase
VSEREWAEVTTAGDLLIRAARMWPDRDALVFADSRHTFADVLSGARQKARALLALGVKPGERIGLLMPNCPDFVETVFAGALVGVPVLTINARFKSQELRHVLGDADVVAVITTDTIAEHVDFAALLDEACEPALPDLRLRILLGSSARAGYTDRMAFEAAAARVADGEIDEARRIIRLRQELLMMYTSGTTAAPKGCPFTHEALVRAAHSIVDRFELTVEDRFWDPLPLYHMAGLLLLMSNWMVGAAYISQLHWDPGEGLRLMVQERCTWSYPTFPTFVQDLVHHLDFPRADLSRIRGVLALGTPAALRELQEQYFPQAIVVSSYGITEGGGVVCFGRLDDPLLARITTGGPPLNCTEVKVVDPETGEDLPAGEVGALVLRGAACAEGYYGDPAATAEAWRSGWFSTGDLARLDEAGRVEFAGRWKDMLKVGGENVAALEIENLLSTHTAVKLAQVVGVPHPRYVEVPAAFVELVDGAAVNEQELIEHCRGTVASFKVPRYVRFVTEWPMSATKIQKFRLREGLVAELGEQPVA